MDVRRIEPSPPTFWDYPRVGRFYAARIVPDSFRLVGESPELALEVGDFFLLGGHELFEFVDIVLLLLLVGFEFLDGFHERG
jgi:hypothetical protein